MSNIGFSTSPTLPWNEHDNPKSIIPRLSNMVTQASIGTRQFNVGEWTTLWKAVGAIMGNSDPTEVCDQEKQGIEYREELISALGGVVKYKERLVYQLNGTTQYIDLMDDNLDGYFAFSCEFTGEAGQEHYIASHATSNTYIRITQTGDMEIKLSETTTLTVPSSDVGDITQMTKIAVDRTNVGNVRVCINGKSVFTAIDREKGAFGFQYLGTDPTTSKFSVMLICNVAVINKQGAHFYALDDRSENLIDGGADGYDGYIVNYNQNQWAYIQYIPSQKTE